MCSTNCVQNVFVDHEQGIRRIFGYIYNMVVYFIVSLNVHSYTDFLITDLHFVGSYNRNVSN